MIVRTSVVTTLLLSVSLFASSDSESGRLGQIKSKLDAILNKAGIHFSGTFRSQYLQSALDPSRSGDSAIDWGKKQTESNEYTSVDFDINARPNEALGARCMFRMHQNWQNFFSDVANPIFLRWMSIDGNVKDMFRFNVGDYRQHYSPLTLWSPDIDIAYEPEIFALKRQEAMKEVFIGKNDPILQGINLNFDAEVVPIFNEFHLNGQIARLRCQGSIIQNGSMVGSVFDDDSADVMDRYVAGANLDIIALKGLGVGASFIDIFDLTSTYDFQDEVPDTMARQTAVVAFRLNPSTKMFFDSDAFEIGIKFEVANSWDRDSSWVDTSVTDSIKSTTLSGMALDAALAGSIRLGGIGSISFNIGYMNNSRDFRNDMAQSPTFLGQRIMNIENDLTHGARLYTTFDALYDYVFKYCPSQINNSNSKWTPEPRRKIAYLNPVVAPEELEEGVDGVDARFDPALQTVLPLGPATPNRAGPKGDVSLKLFNNGIDAGVSVALLNEIEAVNLSPDKTRFLQLGVGLGVDIATWAKVLNCLKLSVGYSMENSENKGDDIKSNNGFLNTGLYYNFWKRFSLLGGFQQIIGTTEIISFKNTVTQTHWAAGVEYKVSEGQRVIARFGQIGADFESNNPAEATIADRNFKAWQGEGFLLVNF